MAQLKILQVNTSYRTGGAANISYQLYNYLEHINDIDSYFAYGRGIERDSKNVYRFTLRYEVFLHAFITRAIGVQGYGSYFSTRKLKRFISKENFDLIHLHNLHGYYLNLDLINFVKDNDYSVVWTFHDAWPITGSCGYFFECDRWKNGCGNCPDKYRYPKTYVDASAYMWKKKKRIFGKGWDPVIVSPSQWLADRVNESYLSHHEVKVIPNAIDTEVFKPRDKEKARQELDIPLDKKVVLFVAADLGNKRKGAEYFFDALQHVESSNWMVMTVGEKVNIENKDTVNINIKQIGYLSDSSKIAKAYNAADVFSITSLDEIFGLTVTEAMASGVPVVGFEVGGIPEQVTQDCGILVEPEDVQGLAEGISELFNNEEKRDAFSENCRDRALEEYSIPKFRDRYLELYQRLVE